MRGISLRKPSIAVLFGLAATALVACAQGGADVPDDFVPVPGTGDDAGATGDDAAPADDSGATTTNPPSGTDSGTTTPPPDTGTPPADTGTPPTPPPPSGSFDYASGLAVSEIAVFQGVKISVWKNGSAVGSRNAPVVIDRPGLVRVYVAPQSGWSAKSVTAQLTLTTGGSSQTFSDTKSPSGASSDATLGSTFDFDLPASAIGSGTTATVALTVPKGAGSASGGSALVSNVALQADNPGSTLKVLLVPVKYTADGSGRLPDTSAAQLAIYQQTLMKLYPARSITITVRAPWTWSQKISASGSGFDTILNSLTTLRQNDNAPSDVYYYAAFEPSSSFNTFCSNGCVAGLSTVASDPTDSWSRVSTGLGYTGVDSAFTMAHEVGHAHGRNHTNTTASGPQCMSPSGNDASYPYASGLIGSWGYDILGKQLMSPSAYGDLMGYCQDTWISDWTYTALFTRMKAVTGGAQVIYPADMPTKFRMVAVHADGSLTWGDEVQAGNEPPVGELTTIRYVSADGSTITTATGHYYAYSDLPGGFLLVPEGPDDYANLLVEHLPANVVTPMLPKFVPTQP
jgi:hypothetical protein